MRTPRISAHELVCRNEIRAVVFDMDGVLADTEAFHLEGWERLAAAWELGPPGALRDLARSTFGQTNDLIIPALWREVGRELDTPVEALSVEKETYYRDAARRRVRPMAGVERLLDWLGDVGIATAIGTSGPTENVEFLLDEFGWHGRFTAIVHRSRFAAGKPAPDCFLRAAEDLDVRPRHAIVFEDSVHGLAAARRGGFWPAAIAGTYPEGDLRPLARWVFRDFEDISCLRKPPPDGVRIA